MSEYDIKINEAKLKVTKTREQLEVIQREFIEAAKGFIVDYIKQTVEQAVFSKPEITKSLGQERLGSLKQDLAKTLDDASQSTQVQLNKSELWGHQIPQKEFDKSSSILIKLQFKTAEKVREALREMLGYAGKLLFAYGYESSGRNSFWERRGDELPRYTLGYSWSPEMDAKMKQYSELMKTFIDLNYNLNELQNEKERAEAQDLWSKA